jgi:VanZ family protein
MFVNPAMLLRVPRAIYSVSALLYMGGIYYLSGLNITIEDTAFPDFWSFCGNLFHFPLYAGLGTLLLLGIRAPATETGPLLNRSTLSIGMVILFLYASFDEIHQSWTRRDPSILDILLDMNGGLCAALILKRLLDKVPNYRSFALLLFLMVMAACGLALAAG